MQRRAFLEAAGKSVASAAVGTSLRGFGEQLAQPADASVKRLLVVFKCHLDVGFTDTQANVMRTYFKQYYPQAIRTAAQMREKGDDRYVWTTGSWLLYEYLEQATGEERRRMDQAVTSGDIAYHALPFS